MPIKVPDIVQMLENGVHFGHKKSRRHPKMNEFIFTTRGEICVIDVRQTAVYLQKALDYIEQAASKGENILFVSTKRQAKALVKKYAENCGMPYVTERWIGGTLTNFSVISQLIKKLKKYKDQQASGELAKYTKKEQLDIAREVEELENEIGGIQTLTRTPDVVFILDLKKDSTACQEALRKNIPVVAVCDTNVNPENVTYPIPGNDDAIRSIDMMMSLLAKAVNEGKSRKAPEVKEVKSAVKEPKAETASESGATPKAKKTSKK